MFIKTFFQKIGYGFGFGTGMTFSYYLVNNVIVAPNQTQTRQPIQIKQSKQEIDSKERKKIEDYNRMRNYPQF